MARTSTCDSVFPPHVGDARLTPGQALSCAPVHFVQDSSNLTILVTVRHLANQVDILDIGRLANRGSWFFHLEFGVAAALPMNDEMQHLDRLVQLDHDFLDRKSTRLNSSHVAN